MEDVIYQQMSEIEEWHWWFTSWRDVIKIFFKKNLAKRRKNLILDIGCGTGYLSTMLNTFGNTIGVDISEYALSFSKKKNYNSLYRTTVIDLPFKNNTFNAIVCAGVLYHNMVEDDERALKEMFRVCKKDGTLVILEPAFKWLSSPHDIVEHTGRRYTLKELCSKVKKSGFIIKKGSYRIFFFFPIVLAVKFFKRIFMQSERAQSDLYSLPQSINKLLEFIMKIEDILLTSINFPIGNTVICVAIKE